MRITSLLLLGLLVPASSLAGDLDPLPALRLGAAQSAVQFSSEPRKPGHLGLGIGIGTRTNGLSAKYTLPDVFSVQGVLGVDGRETAGGRGTIAVSADLLLELPALAESEELELAWALGAGPYIAVGGDFWLGGSAVAQVQLNIRAIPLEFALEYRPSFEILGPASGLQLIDFGGHIRWWFNPKGGGG